MPLFVLHRQRADGPAEIVRVHRAVSYRLVHPPVFAESVTFPGFASIAMSGGPVLALQEGCVDRSANFRHPQRHDHRRQGAEDDPMAHSNDSTLGSDLLHHRIGQPGWYGGNRLPGATGLTRPGHVLVFAVGMADRRRVRRVVVAGHQVHQPTAGAAAKLSNENLRVLDGPGPWYHRHDQAMLGVESDMVPVVALVVIVGVGAIALGFFLADEGPHLIELSLGRPGGKEPPGGPGDSGHDRRTAGYIGRPYLDRPGRAGRSGGPHTLRRDARRPTPPSPRGAEHRRVGCLFVRRSGLCKSGSGACVWSCPGRNEQ